VGWIDSKMKRGLMKDKKGIVWDYMAWMILGVVILVIIIGGIVILSDKGTGALSYISDLFRFG